MKIMEKLYDNSQKKAFISHGDAEKDALYVAEQMKSRLGIETVVTNCIGPVIGGHAGPGTIAIFYMGSER